MKIRGTRECQDCGTRWSYYETGSVTCPDCGSLRSVGVDDRTLHTARPASLNLIEYRNTFDERRLGEWVRDLKRDLRAYRRQRGFVDGGDLVELDETFVGAVELLHAADVYGRLRDPSDDEQLYLLSLLGGVEDGDRPDEVPESMRAARGLAYAEAIDEYRREVRDWLDENPDPDARDALATLNDQLKRVKALEGDVSLGTVERLLAAVRDVSAYLIADDETALVRARERLDRSA